MRDSLITIAYIVASALFILCLGGLSSHETARRGNIYGIFGMSIAFVATAAGTVDSYTDFGADDYSGRGYRRVGRGACAMTSMPELVAILHSFVGAAAVLVGIASYFEHPKFATTTEKTIHRRNFCRCVYRRDYIYGFGRRVRKISGMI